MSTCIALLAEGLKGSAAEGGELVPMAGDALTGHSSLPGAGLCLQLHSARDTSSEELSLCPAATSDPGGKKVSVSVCVCTLREAAREAQMN